MAKTEIKITIDAEQYKEIIEIMHLISRKLDAIYNEVYNGIDSN